MTRKHFSLNEALDKSYPYTRVEPKVSYVLDEWEFQVNSQTFVVRFTKAPYFGPKTANVDFGIRVGQKIKRKFTGIPNMRMYLATVLKIIMGAYDDPTEKLSAKRDGFILLLPEKVYEKDGERFVKLTKLIARKMFKVSDDINRPPEGEQDGMQTIFVWRREKSFKQVYTKIGDDSKAPDDDYDEIDSDFVPATKSKIVTPPKTAKPVIVTETSKYYMDMNDKIVITVPKTKETRTLYRIVSKKNSGLLSPGMKGGYIESVSNLNEKGDCWVGGNAKVYDKATVVDDAVITDDATASGNAVINGKSAVSGNSEVHGDAIVYNSVVKDHAVVAYNAKVNDSVLKDYAVVTGSGKVNDSVLKDYSIIGSEAFVKNSTISGNSYIAGTVKIYDATIKNETIDSNITIRPDTGSSKKSNSDVKVSGADQAKIDLQTNLNSIMKSKAFDYYASNEELAKALQNFSDIEGLKEYVAKTYAKGLNSGDYTRIIRYVDAKTNEFLLDKKVEEAKKFLASIPEIFRPSMYSSDPDIFMVGFLDSWVESSVGKSKIASLSLGRDFGKNMESEIDFYGKEILKATQYDYENKMALLFNEKPYDEYFKSGLKALKEKNLPALKEKYPEGYVTLYRGIRADGLDLENRILAYNPAPFESWSTSSDAAEVFGSVIMTANFPIESVLWSIDSVGKIYPSSYGFDNEKEYVIEGWVLNQIEITYTYGITSGNVTMSEAKMPGGKIKIVGSKDKPDAVGFDPEAEEIAKGMIYNKKFTMDEVRKITEPGSYEFTKKMNTRAQDEIRKVLSVKGLRVIDINPYRVTVSKK